MKYKHSADKKTGSMATGIALGVVAELLLALIGVIVMTTLILDEKIPLSSGKIANAAVLLLSAFAGCVLANKIVRQKPLIVCASTAFIFLIILICGNILIYDGRFNGLWGSAAMVVIGSAISCMISTRVSTKSKRRKRVGSR